MKKCAIPFQTNTSDGFYYTMFKGKRKIKKSKRKKYNSKSKKRHILSHQIHSHQLTNIIPYQDTNCKAIIDSKAIKHNIEYLCKKSGTEIMPIIKANAYGHGIVGVSKILRNLGITYIGVATIGEAILLRNNGDTGRILAWLYDINGQELKDAFTLDIDIAIFDEEHLPIFINMIPPNKKIKITVFVDTGINRAGVRYENAFDTCKKIASCPKLEFVGLMSHLIESEIPNNSNTIEQLYKFRTLRKKLQDININPPLVHIANTNACLNYDVSDFTLARSGMGIFGVTNNSTIIDPHFHLVMTVMSKIIQLKYVNQGECIGYDCTYTAQSMMKIAIALIGYADIIPRLNNNSTTMYVYINGTKRKVLGRISMDQIMIEAHETDKITDNVYIFGNGINCPQTIYDVASIGNRLHIEVLCHTGYRMNITYT